MEFIIAIIDVVLSIYTIREEYEKDPKTTKTAVIIVSVIVVLAFVTVLLTI